jgi:membrane protein implicated in regulation of membrane protease activity
MPEIGLTPLVIYLIIMIGGAVFLFIMFILGGFGDVSFEGGDVGGHFDMGHEIHAEAGGSESVNLSPLSPTILAFAITAFGSFGLIFTSAVPKLEGWLVGIIAMVGAVITAGAVFYVLLNFLGKAQASSIHKSTELVGKIAEVTVRIPKGGTGTIDYHIRGQVSTSSAKAPEDIPQGETVRIKKVVGNIMYVERDLKKDNDDEKDK